MSRNRRLPAVVLFAAGPPSPQDVRGPSQGGALPRRTFGAGRAVEAESAIAGLEARPSPHSDDASLPIIGPLRVSSRPFGRRAGCVGPPAILRDTSVPAAGPILGQRVADTGAPAAICWWVFWNHWVALSS